MSHVYKQVVKPKEAPRYSPVEAVKRYGDNWTCATTIRRFISFETRSAMWDSATFDNHEALAMVLMERGHLPRVEI